MRFALALLILFFSVKNAEAERLTVWGVGYLSCNDYVETRNQDAHTTNKFTQWVLGFVTAYNFVKLNNSDLFQQTDAPRAMLWLENYCREHPLEEFFKAVAALEDELDWETTKKWMPERSE